MNRVIIKKNTTKMKNINALNTMTKQFSYNLIEQCKISTASIISADQNDHRTISCQ